MNKAIINRGALIQSGFDSGKLTPLCVAIHIFPLAGEFTGTVLQDDNPIGNFHLSVNRDSANKQVNIDLANLSSDQPRGPGAQAQTQFDLQIGGAALFYVSTTRGGNAVLIRPSGVPNQTIFDSRTLDKGDIFLVTLMQPGQYTLTNTMTKIQSQVKVNLTPQTGGGAPLKKLAVTTTNVGLKAFGTPSVELQAVQALAVRCDSPSRLTMQISQTFERPKPPVVPGGPGGGLLKPAETQPTSRGKVTWRKQNEFKG